MGCMSPTDPDQPVAISAAQFCTDEGGYELVDNSYCLFPDGSQCELVAFQQGACRPGDSLPTATPTFTPQPSPTATPTVTPSATPTPRPTQTPRPRPSATPTPTATAPASPTLQPTPANFAADAVASASSTLPPDGFGLYSAEFAHDGLSGTTWTEGVTGSGIGEWLLFELAEPIALAELRINVGFDSTAELFFGNNRVAQATVVLDDGERISAEFADQRGLQAVIFDQPRLTQSVQIIIEAVYAGNLYDDTCIAEVELWGTR